MVYLHGLFSKCISVINFFSSDECCRHSNVHKKCSCNFFCFKISKRFFNRLCFFPPPFTLSLSALVMWPSWNIFSAITRGSLSVYMDRKCFCSNSSVTKQRYTVSKSSKKIRQWKKKTYKSHYTCMYYLSTMFESQCS